MALVDCLLSIISNPYKAEFTLKRYNGFNMNFKLVFQTFLDDFGAATERDREENKNRMKASEFVKVPIMGTSNMGTLNAHKTGQYGRKIRP